MSLERLTVAEAARRLGVSPEAVRKRIKRGSIESDQDADGLTHVYVEVGNQGDNPSPDEVGNPHLERLLQGQEREIEYLREQLSAEREANRENRRLLAAALERMPALGAAETSEDHEPSEDAAHGDATQPEGESTRPGLGERVRRWWRG